MKSYGVTFQMKPLWLYSRMNDDITWPRRDVKFLLSVEKYLTRSLRSLVKYFSTQEEKFCIFKRPCNVLFII